ncbi:MAG: chemotaxis protein CheW [Rhodoferax sp.]|nr:chemotaxis protein CheW [Rhodoferax sp.]
MNKNERLDIDTFLPYMRDVIRCESALHELNLMWRLIESSAKMNCPDEAQAILPTMAATREGFNRLEQELVHSLVSEKVGTVLDEIGTQAQYVIDIVVRNLYERTADVGFLATDTELCAFVAGLTDNACAARARLRAYATKYTVYDEIMLLDPQGNVLVQIDETSPIEGSDDPLIAQTLASEGYVETFRHSTLRPHKRRALIYSKRMLHPDTQRVMGVLCLCFHFEQEMAGIFRSHRDPAKRSNMLLLDEHDRVIESADPDWIPLGAVVPVNHSSSPRLSVFMGRQYLVRTFGSSGYQGYPGPAGWQGQVMIPVDVAFTGRDTQTLSRLDARVRAGLLSHAQALSGPLFEIMAAAETIRCVVWNGQVMSAGQQGNVSKLKAILAQISETGARSNALFANSIGDLYETVLHTSLQKSEFVSRLLVDLLDRNLYERSDDCRWWALTPELRHALAAPVWTDALAKQVSGILRYINSLYTVYTRLFVYNAQGHIVASTELTADVGGSIVGATLDAQTLERVLALPNEQAYHVTPFQPDPFYGGQATYTYHAAVRDPHDAQRIVGGVGVVFHAAQEFAAMLRSGVGAHAGMQALFVDRAGKVIASTDAAVAVGATLDLPATALQLAAGQSLSSVVERGQHYHIMGCTASQGYREFKTSDGYRDDVIAVVFDTLGAVRESRDHGADLQMQLVGLPGGERTEYATLWSNGKLFAMLADHVQEAVSACKLTPVPADASSGRVGLMAWTPTGQEPASVWVFDLGLLLTGKRSVVQKSSQIVVLRCQGRLMGLLVDALHGVTEFRSDQIIPTPFGGGANAGLVRSFIKANGGDVLVQVVDVMACLERVFDRTVATGAGERLAAA